jgi:hypothetical protein
MTDKMYDEDNMAVAIHVIIQKIIILSSGF